MTLTIGEGSIKKSNKTPEKVSPVEKARRKAAESRRSGKGGVVFQLTRGKTRTQIIPARCVATENQQQISLRYIPGVRQVEESKQGRIIGKTAKAIVLRGGKKIAADEALKEYLRRYPGNVANGGNIFYEYNPVKEAEVELEKEIVLDKAKFMATQGINPTQAYQMAKLYGIKNIDHLSDVEIRKFLRAVAIADPLRFNDMLDSPEAEMNDTLAKSFTKGTIEYSRDGLTLRYKGGGEVLRLSDLSAEGKIDAIIRWGMTDEDGSSFFDVLRNGPPKKTKVATK